MFVLCGVDRLPDSAVRHLLVSAGVADAEAALRSAERLDATSGGAAPALLRTTWCVRALTPGPTRRGAGSAPG
ncbi:hypothetical protein [Streptomyces avermitilis]|uniref:hypothetical protein n=1 Tax=Streptomyces avermitilis TaxID=33903 RepID=UPI0038238FAB